MSVLTLNSVNATENGGTYECVTINDAGFAVVRSTLFVSPLIVEHPQDQLAMNSDNITLVCHAESFPFPRYQWQKYNRTAEEFQDVAGANDPEYSIVSVTFSDYGDYRCMATSPMINQIAYSNNATVTGK